MSKEKGYLKDADRFTTQHQEMCLWFTEDKNAKDFVRIFLGDLVFDLKTKLEIPVKSKSGFLYGYADVCLSYQTDQSKQENVLIEVKSSFTDFGEVLRQIRTYQEYLGNITKTCLIHSGLDDEQDKKATQYFVSQGIYIVSLGGVKEEIKIALTEDKIKVPAGKRSAELCSVWFSSERKHWDLSLLVEYDDKYLGRKTSDLLDTGNYFEHKEKFWEILDKFGLNINIENPATIPHGEISFPCSVDISYRPDKLGYPEAVIERVYINGEIMELIK